MKKEANEYNRENKQKKTVCWNVLIFMSSVRIGAQKFNATDSSTIWTMVITHVW